MIEIACSFSLILDQWCRLQPNDKKMSPPPPHTHTHSSLRRHKASKQAVHFV